MEPIPVALSQIVVDPQLQPRVEGIDGDHVRELEAVAEHWPALKVVKRGDRYLLVDGFHRLAAAQTSSWELFPLPYSRPVKPKTCMHSHLRSMQPMADRSL